MQFRCGSGAAAGWESAGGSAAAADAPSACSQLHRDQRRPATIPSSCSVTPPHSSSSTPSLCDARGERFTTLPMSTASAAAGEAAKAGLLNCCGRAPKVGVDAGVGADTSGLAGIGRGALLGRSPPSCCCSAAQERALVSCDRRAISVSVDSPCSCSSHLRSQRLKLAELGSAAAAASKAALAASYSSRWNCASLRVTCVSNPAQPCSCPASTDRSSPLAPQGLGKVGLELQGLCCVLHRLQVLLELEVRSAACCKCLCAPRLGCDGLQTIRSECLEGNRQAWSVPRPGSVPDERHKGIALVYRLRARL